MKKVLYIKIAIVLFIVSFVLSVSAQENKLPVSSPYNKNILEEYEKGYFSQIFGFNITHLFNSSLYDTISDWLGTPYRYSGKNADGIDCSGFVNMVYRNVYGILLSGNSLDLYKAVKRLSKNKLTEGDLVFFKIHHHKVSHVGLYLGDNKFVHSSLSNGVTISDLDDPYYKKYFAGGGRVN